MPPFTPDDLAPLPVDAAALLQKLAAPPRLVAHLSLVHDVARRIVAALHDRWPSVAFDDDAVFFGAATHDIGKAVHREELDAKGSQHEEEGRRLLQAHGVDPHRARFAVTHATWSDASPLEELLVSLADKIWKGKRVEELETLVIARIAALTGAARWDVFRALDDVIAAIAADADARLAWQGRHPSR